MEPPLPPLPPPTVTVGKILVNVKASGVNPADWKIREWYFQQWAESGSDVLIDDLYEYLRNTLNVEVQRALCYMSIS